MITVTNPNALTIALFIISFLLTALLALLGFFGVGINRRFDVVFKELEKYQLEKVCTALMTTKKEQIKKVGDDVNKLGEKVENIKRKVCH